MAQCAGNRCVRSCERERRVVVVEDCACPRCGVVACGAGGGEACRDVIRIGRCGVLVLMAGVTIGRRRRKVACGVARCAGNRFVCPGERERCVVVVEDRACPCRGVVTIDAGGGESRRDVIRVGCSGVFRLMAGVAVFRRCRKVACSVAQCAGNRFMSASERERSVVVVEDRACPCRGVVTIGAGSGESRRDVIRVGCGGVFRLMAGVAIFRRCRKVACSVAQCAGNRFMSAGERERSVVVIEVRAGPSRSVVTSFAGSGEARGGVIRVGRARVVRLMAGVAVCRRRRIVAACMAEAASNGSVRSGERIMRVKIVVEFGVKPGACGVARSAIAGQV